MMIRLCISLLLLVVFAGCATVPHPGADIGRTTPGVYHEVRRGETLWSISRIHNVELPSIIKANRLPNASKIEVGQLIFIPEAEKAAGKAIYAKHKTLEGFIWPVKGVVTSYFGSTKSMAKNKGIDIETRWGANVVASRSGRVTFTSDHMKGYGKTIIIDHRDGFQTVYTHNAENLVGVDQEVKQGQVIARVGKTGRVDKPTLHFEIRKQQKPQNPFYYLP